MKELIQPGRTGALFEPGNSAQMANTVVDLRKDLSALAAMRRFARQEFLEKYDFARNHRVMLDIYSMAIERREGIEESETVAAT